MEQLNNTSKKYSIIEKEAKKANGIAMLLFIILGMLVSIALIIFSAIKLESSFSILFVTLIPVSIIAFIVFATLCGGLKSLQPNEALVLTLFGKYYGTIKESGYFFVNPFCQATAPKKKDKAFSIKTNADSEVSLDANLDLRKRISLKTMTLSNSRQKVNDALGNPIIIGANVIWHVDDPTKAVFNVENFFEFLSIQCDSTIRNIARLYPYDTIEEDADEKTLRGSSKEIADVMETELLDKVSEAGIVIDEVRITHLAYSEEIAAAMLQKQQAVAIIAARQKIVEGAVSMVKMAIDQLSEEEILVLDEERKAAMVSNLLVILCGNKEAQPIINSGSIY